MLYYNGTGKGCIREEYLVGFLLLVIARHRDREARPVDTAAPKNPPQLHALHLPFTRGQLHVYIPLHADVWGADRV